MNEIHVDTRNRVFDTVLNLNIVQEEKKMDDPVDISNSFDPFTNPIRL